MQERLGTYEPQLANNDEEVKEVIPHFLELKIQLDSKRFRDFSYEFLTNETEMPYDIFKDNKQVGDKKFMSVCKNKFNK